MSGLLLLVQRGGAWAGCGPAQSGCGPAQSNSRCTKCTTANCTNFILFDVALQYIPVPIKGLNLLRTRLRTPHTSAVHCCFWSLVK